MPLVPPCSPNPLYRESTTRPLVPLSLFPNSTDCKWLPAGYDWMSTLMRGRDWRSCSLLLLPAKGVRHYWVEVTAFECQLHVGDWIKEHLSSTIVTFFQRQDESKQCLKPPLLLLLGMPLPFWSQTVLLCFKCYAAPASRLGLQVISKRKFHQRSSAGQHSSALFADKTCIS